MRAANWGRLESGFRAVAGPGIEFHAGEATDLGFLADESVNVVFTSNLLEHLDGKREVERVLKEARRVLKPGGHFIAMGPNLRFLPGQYWDFWDHTVPITDRSLVEILLNLGYEIVDCIPKFLPYTTCGTLPKAAFWWGCTFAFRWLGESWDGSS